MNDFFTFKTTVLSTGFQLSKYDPSSFLSKSSHSFARALIYIDNIFITENNVQIITKLQAALAAAFRMKGLEVVQYFFDLKVHLHN
jgi:hypothetical protein